MTLVTIPGRAAAAVAATAAPKAAQGALAVLGEDLIGVWVIHISPGRLPGVAAPGDAIGMIRPLSARRGAYGGFAAADGRGAPLAQVGGRLAASTATTPLWCDARPVDRSSFGIGMLYNFTADALSVTRDHMGNNESGGGKDPAILSRSVGGAPDQMVKWKGITASWLTSQSADLQERARIRETGWHILAADEDASQSALSIDARAPIIAPTDSIVPTLSAIRFGGTSDATPGMGAVTAFMVCDGPLVQDAARLAAWRGFCDAVLDDLRG